MLRYLTTRACCLLLLSFTYTAPLAADEPLFWHFSHSQDLFALAPANADSSLRTSGLTQLGLTWKSQTTPWSLLVDGLWVNRDDPFTPLLNDFNGVSNIAGEKTLRLYHGVLQYGDENSRWSSSIGLQIIDDNFLIVEEAALLLNSGFGMASVITGNTLVPSYPLSSAGLHIRYRNTDAGYYAALGIYDGNSGSQTNNPNGLDIDFSSDDGMVIIAEAGWQLTDTPGNRHGMKIGAWHHSGHFFNSSRARSEAHNSALYAILEGQVRVNSRQVGYFARAARMRALQRSQVTQAIETGLKLYAPFSMRPRDALSIGLIWSHFGAASIAFQEDLQTPFVHADEWVLEVNYSLQINTHLQLQPDLQWIINPHNGRANTLLAGARISFSF